MTTTFLAMSIEFQINTHRQIKKTRTSQYPSPNTAEFFLNFSGYPSSAFKYQFPVTVEHIPIGFVPRQLYHHYFALIAKLINPLLEHFVALHIRRQNS